MDCASCGATLLPGKSFCHVCGAAAAAACPHCGASVEAGFAFCPDCGGRLLAAAAPARGPTPVAEDPAETPRLARTAPIAGERKQVTVLFCDLKGSTAIAEGMDPEHYRDLLDRYLDLSIREIDRMGGMVNQLAGDGFMALFGAPIALEDEPERAVRAALSIQEALGRLNSDGQATGEPELLACIGIHTGPVVVGTVGNDLKMDYTAIGDTTNLAARLQALAEPGAILISEVTRNLVAGQVELSERPPVEVKGKREAVTPYQVLGMTDAVTPMSIAEARGLTPLVGLEQELAQLEACFERIHGGMPQLVSVVGDPGSGKSRLVYEFKQRLADRDPILFEARASTLTQALPFAPLTNMLKSYFGLAPGETQDCACEKIAAQVKQIDPALDAIYPAMCQLLTTPSEDLATEGLRERTIQAFAGLVGSLVENRSVLWILEDLHWFDEASLEVLERLVARMERLPVMVLVTHRPEYQASWHVRSAHTQLWLRPLTADESRQVARARAGGALPEELEQRIVKRAEGNPFFVEEITRALVEQGQIVPEEGGVRLTGPIEAIRIPDTVQELIEARLDRLTPTTKRVAQMASVLGRQFRADQLTAVLEPEGIDTASALKELESRGLVHVASADRGEFRFGESLTQSVSYESLLLRERRELHERVAALIESDPRGMTAERAGLVAHHLSRSENRTRAIESLLMAARHAEDLPSYPSATSLFRQAWELAEQELGENDDERSRRWVLDATMGVSRLVVLYSSPESQDEERAARRGQEIAELLGDAEALSRMVTLQGSIVSGSDGTRFDEGVALMERGLELAREAGSDLAAINAQRGLGWSYLMDGQFAKANDALERVRAMLEELGQADPPSDLYLSVLYFLMTARLWQEDLAGAEALATKTLALCEQKNNRTLAGASLSVLAHVHFLLAQYSVARDWADRAYASGVEIGNLGATRSGAMIGTAARLELAESVHPKRLLEVADETVDGRGDFSANAHLMAETLIAIGEVERAAHYADQAALRSGGRLRRAQSMLATAHALAARGPAHRDEAAEEFRLVAQVAQEIGSSYFQIAAAIGLGRLGAARGDRSAAAGALQEAADAAERTGLVRLRDQALRALAEARGMAEAGADTLPPRIN